MHEIQYKSIIIAAVFEPIRRLHDHLIFFTDIEWLNAPYSEESQA